MQRAGKMFASAKEGYENGCRKILWCANVAMLSFSRTLFSLIPQSSSKQRVVEDNMNKIDSDYPK